MSPAVGRWLVLPGLLCPPSSFDAVRAELAARGTVLELRVVDPWGVATAAELLPDDGRAWGVVGHSLGGLRAVELVLARPERVSRLLLLDPTPPDEQGPPAPVRRALVRGTPVVLRGARRLGILHAAGLAVGLRWTAEDPVRLASTAAWQRWAHELFAGWDVARDVDRLLRTARPSVPTVQLVAGRSGARARRRQGRLARRLRATLVVAPRAGHLLMVDRPDLVADELAR